VIVLLLEDPEYAVRRPLLKLEFLASSRTYVTLLVLEDPQLTV
jgi:hypothetical protein